MGNNRSILFYPFSLVYGLITSVRNFLYNTNVLKSREFKVPVICVGNLAVGGTGKTPHTEYLINLLKDEFRVAVLSRGYKRKTKGFLTADQNSTTADIGDEPLQMFKKYSSITVAVDGDRVRGVERILEMSPETAVIILDDGYQHRRINPGFSILLTDFSRLFIRDHLLPYGNLRENASNMNRADVILVTKSPENLSPIQRRIIVKEINKAPYQNLYFTSLAYSDPLPVFPECPEFRHDPADNEEVKDSGIVLVTGIANPQPLLEHLKKTIKEVIHIPFPDHRLFTARDISRIYESWNSLKSGKRYVFTTEKDAVRLREITNIAEPFRSSFFYIPSGIKFLNDDAEEFANLIKDYVRKNKRNNRIS